MKKNKSEYRYRYQETIEKLNRKGRVFGLDTMTRLLDLLGRPERELKIIHVAGTNGKGSTIAFLDTILRKSGYSVGKYISPTIFCYEERFGINGSYISGDRLEEYYACLEKVMAEMEKEGLTTPTLFEAETAIALMYFRDEKVDYALVEAGLGGASDATNAVEATFMSVITSISEDHKDVLGDTVEAIALQKAGIIRPGVPVVLAVNRDTVVNVIEKTAEQAGSECLCIRPQDYLVLEEGATGNRFLFRGERYSIRMPGGHQTENAMTAVRAAMLLHTMPGGDRITIRAIKEGLEETRWPGRLELIRRNPPFYLDGAHNPDGASKLAVFLEKHFTKKRIIYIMGVLKDKDYHGMLSCLIPLASHVYAFTPANPRGLSAEDLAAAVRAFSVETTVCMDVNEAVELAVAEEKQADCFVLCGSLSFMEDFYRGKFYADRKPPF